MQRATRGRREANRAFEAACLPYEAELYAAAVRMTRHAEDAGDLVQETLLRAYQAWPAFDGGNTRAWLYRILTNSYINIYRKRRRHARFAETHPGDVVAAFYGRSEAHIETARDRLLEDALGDEVTRALAGLGDDYRQVIELADLRGIRYRDIAADLALPLGTVMSRLFRARRKLEKQLRSFAAADYGIGRAA